MDSNRGKQVVSFEYGDEWLNDLTNNVTLDPDLRMFKGRQYAPVDKLMFGVFEVGIHYRLTWIRTIT